MGIAFNPDPLEIDPGETTYVTVTVTNSGASPIPNVVPSLTIDGPPFWGEASFVNRETVNLSSTAKTGVTYTSPGGTMPSGSAVKRLTESTESGEHSFDIKTTTDLVSGRTYTTEIELDRASARDRIRLQFFKSGELDYNCFINLATQTAYDIKPEFAVSFSDVSGTYMRVKIDFTCPATVSGVRVWVNFLNADYGVSYTGSGSVFMDIGDCHFDTEPVFTNSSGVAVMQVTGYSNPAEFEIDVSAGGETGTLAVTVGDPGDPPDPPDPPDEPDPEPIDDPLGDAIDALAGRTLFDVLGKLDAIAAELKGMRLAQRLAFLESEVFGAPAPAPSPSPSPGPGPAPVPPPSPPASGLTTQKMVDDMTQSHEALLDGINPSWSWGSGPRIGVGANSKYPTTSSGGGGPCFVPWGIVASHRTAGVGASNTRIQIRRLICDQLRGGVWQRKIFVANQIEGALYLNYETNENAPADIRTHGTEGISVKLPSAGGSFHFNTSIPRTIIEATGTTHRVVTIEMRLILDNPQLADDRANATVYGLAGGDYWRSREAQWTQGQDNNDDFAIGRATKPGINDWTFHTAHTMGSDTSAINSYLAARPSLTPT